MDREQDYLIFDEVNRDDVAFEDLIQEEQQDSIPKFITEEMKAPTNQSKWQIIKRINNTVVVEPSKSGSNYKFLVTRYIEDGRNVYEICFGDWDKIIFSRYGKVMTEILNFIMSLTEKDVLKIRLGYDGPWCSSDIIHWCDTLHSTLDYCQAEIVTCLDNNLGYGETCVFMMGDRFSINPLGHLVFDYTYLRYEEGMYAHIKYTYSIFEDMAVEKGLLLQEELDYLRKQKTKLIILGPELQARMEGNSTSQVPKDSVEATADPDIEDPVDPVSIDTNEE
jgi:hypothetical protein